jgi:hypothetical protein
MGRAEVRDIPCRGGESNMRKIAVIVEKFLEAEPGWKWSR